MFLSFILIDNSKLLPCAKLSLVNNKGVMLHFSWAVLSSKCINLILHDAESVQYPLLKLIFFSSIKFLHSSYYALKGLIQLS